MRFIASLAARAEYVDIEETIALCRDPKDNALLELAASGQATHVVTGDQDLLVLHLFRNTIIQAPSEFLAKLKD